MNEKTINKLKAIASKISWSDEMVSGSNVYDFAGGNIDDAYQGGYDSGKADLAREILTDLGIEY